MGKSEFDDICSFGTCKLFFYAEHGDANAQSLLGMRYQYALGVEPDEGKAIKWHHKAAEQGIAESQCFMGQYYSIDQQKEEAVKWFRKAAEQGNGPAQFSLGSCYERGDGIESDINKAIYWYHKAAGQGVEEAIESLRRLEDVWIGDVTFKRFAQDYPTARGFRALNKRLYVRHLANGDTEDVPGVALCDAQGNALCVLALSKRLYGKTVEEIAQMANNLYVFRKKNINQDDEQKTMFLLSSIETDGNQPSTVMKSTPLKKSEQQIPYYLFFDTETTGLPKNLNADVRDFWKWPRLVQLAWILTDATGNILSYGNNIIKPEGFSIPNDATKVHGITTAKALREGKPLRSVIDNFMKDANSAKYIVAHNIIFDQKIVGAELCRLRINDTISTVRGICTMRASEEYCNLSKPPKLQELYKKLFGNTFDNAHDAMADVKATMKCFFELIRIGDDYHIFYEELCGRESI